MTKARRFSFFVMLLVLTGFFTFRWFLGSNEPTRDEAPDLVYKRIWLERVPDSPTDYAHGLYLLSTPSAGVFQRSSAFDYHFELFRHDMDKNKLKMTFPQTNKTATVTITIKKCDDLPPFDLCLTLSENPWSGPKKYYGFFETEDESKAVSDAQRTLLVQLAEQAQ